MSKARPTLEELKLYASHTFAISSFISVSRQIAEFLKLKPDQDIEEHRELCEALSTSILTNYFRPFKGRPPFRITEEAIPPEHMPIHRELEVQRDKIYAHRDHNLPDATWGNVNETGIVVGIDGSIMPKVLIGIMTEQRMKELGRLVEVLDNHYGAKVSAFIRLHVPPGIVPGEYVFNLKDDEEPWLKMVG